MITIESLYAALQANAKPIALTMEESPPVDTLEDCVRHITDWLIYNRQILDSIVSILEGWPIEMLQMQPAETVALRLRQIYELDLAGAGIDHLDVREAIYEVARSYFSGGVSSVPVGY